MTPPQAPVSVHPDATPADASFTGTARPGTSTVLPSVPVATAAPALGSPAPPAPAADDDAGDYAPTVAPELPSAPPPDRATTPTTARATAPITNRFAKWDVCAAIRSKPRQRLRSKPGSGDQFHYFSPELVALGQHPRIVAAKLSTSLELQHLYHYLRFTAILEHQYVNPMMIRISSRDIGYELPRSMVVDAYRIYCDEGYHALCSADLAQQVEDHTGIVAQHRELPQAFRQLNALLAARPEAQRPLIAMAFVIVSETLVSAILTRSHLDTRVEPSVRQVILEHAQDEAVHGAYFADLTRLIWPQMRPEDQVLVASLVPQLILNFLAPDRAQAATVLTHAGFAPDESTSIIAECFPEADIVASARWASTGTVALFQSVGAFDSDPCRAALVGSGLGKA